MVRAAIRRPYGYILCSAEEADDAQIGSRSERKR